MGHLVIGLGGAGFKALCMLKAALRDSNLAGVLPAGVAVRAVDTESPDIAMRNRLSEIIGYGGVPLDRNHECIWLGENDPPIGANLYPVVHALQRGRLTRSVGGDIQSVPVNHITSWFQATTLVNLLDAGNWNVSIGAGQQRQIARLALFWNVQSPGLSSFHRKISAGIHQALAGNDLNVLLVSSTIGGTGAGLLLDVAYLVRALAPEGTPCLVTALLLLPETFSGVFGSNDQALKLARARTYAFKREIEGFSAGALFTTSGLRIIYNPGSPLPQYRGDKCTRRKLLDAVYYLDGANHLGNIVPEDGVIPLVADVSLALLSETGTTRQNHMLNVLTVGMGGVLALTDPAEMSFCGGVGSHSIFLPMARIVDTLSWRLVKEAALLLAEPGEPAGTLNPNRPGGVAGRSEVTSFCDVGPITGRHRDPTTEVVENLSAGSTDLLQDIRTQGEAYGDGANLLQAEWVARQFEGHTLASWAPKLQLRATDKADSVRAAWEGELGKNFVADDPNKPVLVPVTVRGEDNRAAWRRVRARVDQEFVNILGTEQAIGTFSGGTLQGMLNGMKAELLQTLRWRLWLKTLNILNGQTPAGGQADLIRQQRGNSLGYLYDFLLALRQLLLAYREAILAGRARRARRGGMADHIRVAYDDICQEGQRQPVPGPFGVGAENLRRRLLQRAQSVLDLCRTDQVESMILDVVATMLQDVASLQKSILQEPEGTPGWSDILAVGGDASVVGIAETERLRAEQAGQGYGSPVREVIWDTDYNERLYRQYAGDGAAGVVGALDWWLLQPGEQGSAGLSLQLWMGTTRIADVSGVKSRMVQRARQAFDLAWQQEGVLQYMANRSTAQLWTPPTVAARLQTKSPLALAAGWVGQESMYLVVPAATDKVTTDYREALIKAVRGVPADPLKPDYLGSDGFRLTFIRWRDLIDVSNLPSLVAAKQDYQAYWSKYRFPDPDMPGRLTRETLHVFPGEVEAVGIETLLPLTGSSVVDSDYELHPGVVRLLDDVGLVQSFFLAWAWGVIFEQALEVDSRLIRTFVLELPERRDGPITECPAREYWLTAPEQVRAPSFFAALHNWSREGVDYHRGPADDQGRTRPSPVLMDSAWEELVALSTDARSRCLAEAVAATPDWLLELPAQHLASLNALPPEQARTASLHWAEASYLEAKLNELRKLEVTAQPQVERDTIRVLMVLLWRAKHEAQRAFESALSVKESTV